MKKSEKGCLGLKVAILPYRILNVTIRCLKLDVLRDFVKYATTKFTILLARFFGWKPNIFNKCMVLDRNKLRKLLYMTTSSHDGEILNAIKLANIHLKENNLTWEDIINNNGMSNIDINLQNCVINYDKKYAKIPQEIRDIVGMIESLARMHKYSREFSTLLLFTSSKILWGNLTEKEYEGLKKIFEKEMIKKKDKDEKWLRKYGIRMSEQY